jgi:rhodanese-related sulfurtransferase
MDVPTLQAWLGDGGEVAFVEIREEGIQGEGHPLLAINIPYSRLEWAFPLLVPRPATRIVFRRRGRSGGPARGAASRGIGLYGGACAARRRASLGRGGRAPFPQHQRAQQGVCRMHRASLPHPDIEAAALDQLRRTKRDVIVLDSRTREELSAFTCRVRNGCIGLRNRCLRRRRSWWCPAPGERGVSSGPRR